MIDLKIRGENVILLGVSLLVGLVLTAHTKQGSDSYDTVSLKTVESLREEISSMDRKIERIDSDIQRKRAEVEEMKVTSGQGDEARLESIRQAIGGLKLHSGLIDVEGPGIELIIADNMSDEIVGKNVNDDIIHDSDIQIIINDLKRAGAEAISINGQRLISRSEIKCGGPVIKINQRSSANPFIISAIGDPKLLSAAIQGPGSYARMLRDVYRIEVGVNEFERLRVPKYNMDTIEYRHIDLEEEG